MQLLVQLYGEGVKGGKYRREMKEKKREQRGGERYVLLEEQVLSGQLGLQDLLEGGGVISALSKLQRSFHHWRTRHENRLDCLERPSCGADDGQRGL